MTVRVERRDPPAPAGAETTRLLAALFEVAERGDGEWYSLATFDGASTAGYRATTLRRRTEGSGFEFRAAKTPGKDRSELFARERLDVPASDDLGAARARRAREEREARGG